MPGKKDAAKPKGKNTAYTCFVATCRDEHKKKNPGAKMDLADFSKKCGEKWKVVVKTSSFKKSKRQWRYAKAMNAKDKKRFEDLAAKDKIRYEKEMANYTPADDGKRKKKQKKDPNAPKRALSAFFCFCAEERPKIKAKFPDMPIGDVAKELGKRWEACQNRTKYEQLSQKDKDRYAKESATYKKSGGADAFKKSAAGKAPAKKGKPAPPPEDDDEEDEEDEEEDEESD